MSRKKRMLKRWVFLAGLLILVLLKTHTALALLYRSDPNSDNKCISKHMKTVKIEFARDGLIPRNTNTARKHIAMLQKGQDTKFDITSEKKSKKRIPSSTKRKKRTTPRPKRFKDNGDGTVTDSKTGLMWTKNANLLEDTITFNEALEYIEGINEGKYQNFGYTDWRLPTLREFRNLIDYTKYIKKGHTLPGGHPFQNVQSLKFYGEKSDSYLSNSEYPRFFSLYCTLVGRNIKSCYGYIWPVRSLPDYDRHKRNKK